MRDLTRTRWAAVGAAIAITLGAGGVALTQAAVTTGPKPVYIALDAPCRVVDTRPASQIGPKGTPIAAGEANAYEIQITGNSGNCTGGLAVPADAVAVALNVTAIAPVATATGRSFFTVYPANASLPTTSNLNFLNGQPPVPNKVDVGLSPAGRIKIFNAEGTAHAAVDIFGYYIDHQHTGDDIVDESLTGADIKNGSLTRLDILDEPGIVSSFQTDAISLTGTNQTVVGAAIRVPADGYLDIHVSGDWYNGTATAMDKGICQIQKNGTVPLPGFVLSDRNAVLADWTAFSAHRVVEVSVADNPMILFNGQSINLVCRETSGDVRLDNVQISATYYPTRYAPLTLAPIIP
jgi:hypothetical protein